MTAATTVTNAEETKVWGVWTPEEFKDALAFAVVVAAVSFIITLLYRWTDAYLKATTW